MLPVLSVLSVLSEQPGVWLTLSKKGMTTPTSLTYAQALQEALCQGWRRAAADAVRGLALAGGLDGPVAGGVLGAQLLQPTVSLGRVASTLSDAARGDRAAQRLVWDLLAAALPAVLAGGH